MVGSSGEAFLYESPGWELSIVSISFSSKRFSEAVAIYEVDVLLSLLS